MGRKRRRKTKGPGRGGARLLQLDLLRLEVARGYDGPLRGRPEPVLLFGVYRVEADRVTLLERALHRLRSSGPDPEQIEVDAESWEVRAPRVLGMRLAVLAVALEEDSGRGVAQLYADLGAPEQLALWPTEARDPDPITLLEHCRGEPPRAPATESVHLVDGARDLRDAELGDDWVGAAVFHVDDEAHPRVERRMRFRSPDGRNDWTAVIETRAI